MLLSGKACGYRGDAADRQPPHPVDLLLCGHHFRVSQASLQAAGANAYDKAGLLIMAGTRTAGTSRPRAGGLVGTAHSHRA
jgi:hypothetical protein